jgi:hypothetical protein
VESPIQRYLHQILGVFKGVTRLLLLLILAALPLPAVARGLATIIEKSGAPITITACHAIILDPVESIYPVRVALDFRNDGAKTATMVRFFLRARDEFGQQLASLEADNHGTFAPGIVIENYGGSRATTMLTGTDDVGSVTCRVEMVQFSDGSEWHGPATQPPRLYFPPTPSPTVTPSSETKYAKS